VGANCDRARAETFARRHAAMLLKSRLGRHLVTRVARAYGFLDPVALLARLRGFAQTSEVGEPIELLRAGVLFHARGLVNTKAIQHNLDWVWPYWVERQFNPRDPSFIPRAFSFSHINLTHRNWTAVGLPDVPYYPIVDPRGLVTPLYDGWSLDFWLLPEKGPALVPSKLPEFEQELHVAAGLRIRSVARWKSGQIVSEVELALERDEPVCRISVRATGGELVVALRPYNAEGVSSVSSLELHDDAWLVNGRHPVYFSRVPLGHRLSTYADGDVALRLHEPMNVTRVECPAAMASAAALFPATAEGAPALEVRVPIYDELEPRRRPKVVRSTAWPDALESLARLTIADAPLQRLYDLARTNIVLHTPEDPYPGPYTYKRFWFRDAVFILSPAHAGRRRAHAARAEQIRAASTPRRLLSFPGRRMGQQRRGAVVLRPLCRAHGRNAARRVAGIDGARCPMDPPQAPAARQRQTRSWPSSRRLQRGTPRPERFLLLG
jgi:hypothetical protein